MKYILFAFTISICVSCTTLRYSSLESLTENDSTILTINNQIESIKFIYNQGSEVFTYYFKAEKLNTYSETITKKEDLPYTDVRSIDYTAIKNNHDAFLLSPKYHPRNRLIYINRMPGYQILYYGDVFYENNTQQIDFDIGILPNREKAIKLADNSYYAKVGKEWLKIAINKIGQKIEIVVQGAGRNKQLEIDIKYLQRKSNLITRVLLTPTKSTSDALRDISKAMP